MSMDEWSVDKKIKWMWEMINEQQNINNSFFDWAIKDEDKIEDLNNRIETLEKRVQFMTTEYIDRIFNKLEVAHKRIEYLESKTQS